MGALSIRTQMQKYIHMTFKKATLLSFLLVPLETAVYTVIPGHLLDVLVISFPRYLVAWL